LSQHWARSASSMATSAPVPLYALSKRPRAAAHGGPLVPEAILGVVSLILWSLILIISVKYALLILRADNRGEGGIVALLALLHARNAQPGTWRAQLLIVGLVGSGAALRATAPSRRPFPCSAPLKA